MSNKHMLVAVLTLVIGLFLLVGRASAQSACSQLGADCSHQTQPSYSSQPSAAPDTTSTGPSSVPRTVPTRPNMNTVIKQQVAGSLVDAFVNLLFSTDSRAEEQKRQMMEELERRKAEAERQHKFEEAQRLDAMCNRLSASLKLDGVPKVRMKFGDNDDEHSGIKGLPGIALNDNTGNGGNTPYGIRGLPGIYTNGPGSGGSTQTSQSKVKMKFGDEVAPPQATGSMAISAPAVEGSAVSGEVSDPRNMTTQQLADLATVVSKLPPAEQQRLMDAAKNAAMSNSGANLGTPSQAVASGASSQPAMSQLQQITKTSQSAASAQNLEDAAAQARAGFDQAIPGSPISAASTSRPTPSSSTPGSSQTTSTSTKAPVAGSVRSSGQVTNANLKKPDPQKPMFVQQLSTGTPGRAPGCPIVSKRKLPTREELAQELAGLRFRLDVLKNSFLRLSRSIQMDQGQFAEWEKETQNAVDRANERLKKTIADQIEDRFFDYSEEYYSKSPEKLKALKRVEVVLKENDVYDWADSGAKTWDQVAEGLALLGENLPISKSAQEILWASKSTIDSAFDIATELVSWRRISQLQKNSDDYLSAVKRSGEQMKQIVGRMREIENRLASGSSVAENKAPQAGAALCE
jgi:hypothetical protein